MDATIYSRQREERCRYHFFSSTFSILQQKLVQQKIREEKKFGKTKKRKTTKCWRLVLFLLELNSETIQYANNLIWKMTWEKENKMKHNKQKRWNQFVVKLFFQFPFSNLSKAFFGLYLLYYYITTFTHYKNRIEIDFFSFWDFYRISKSEKKMDSEDKTWDDTRYKCLQMHGSRLLCFCFSFFISRYFKHI